MSADMKNLTKNVQDRIRDLAYLMWESAGRQQNVALQYWLNAEREISSSIQAATDVMISAPTQRQEAVQKPAEPSPVDEIEARQDKARPGKEGATQAAGKKLALAESAASQPIETAGKAQAKAAATEAPGEKPAIRRAGGRKKPTKQ